MKMPKLIEMKVPEVIDEQELKEIDRDQYYHALNLIDEYDGLQPDIYDEWREDVDDLEEHYRYFVWSNIINGNEK